MELSEQGVAGADGAEERNDAAEAVAGIVGLVLTPMGWARVGRALDGLESGLRSGDPDVLNAAAGQLELVTPTRIRTRLGEEGEPAPPELLERANRLVHALRSEARDPGEDEPDGDDPH
ncbi:CATRA system-associated protein [Streptomyces sp. NPDC060027]|uniref:CATRA system-associated protein n=1 Tax=Streptomyces sp. NPDC060027 TaxID=3347040 RepID=UPI0036B8C7A6